MTDRWLTVDEAAAHVRRSRETIRRWIRNGELSATFDRVRASEVVQVERQVRHRKNQHSSPKADARDGLIGIVVSVVDDDGVARAVADAILDSHDVKPKTHPHVP